MKKLLLIILLACFVVIITTPVLAKVKFRNWDKWDQQLPDMNNKYWSWTFPGEKSTMSTIEGQLILITTYLYFGTSKNRASVIFYSPASQKTNIKKDYIPGPKFALVCFPSEKKKSIVRAYEIRNIEEGLSQFIEEWEIPFNQYQDGVPIGVKFREIFWEWLNQQAPSKLAESLKTINEKNTLNMFLPKLRIDAKGGFKLVPPISDDFINIISVTPGSGLIDGVDNNFKVVVKYNLFTSNEGLLQVAFNNQESINSVRFVKDAYCLVYKGDGMYEFNVTVKPKNWGSQGDFRVLVTLDEIPWVSDYFLVTDEKILTFK